LGCPIVRPSGPENRRLGTVSLNALDRSDGLAHRRLEPLQTVSCLQLSPPETIAFVFEPYAQSKSRIGIDLAQLTVLLR
jgi:hypothetical protein